MSSPSYLNLALRAPDVMRFTIRLFEAPCDEEPESFQERIPSNGVWVEYVQPKDTYDFEECKKVDEKNREAWAFNRLRMYSWRRVFKAMKICGDPPHLPPPHYVKQMQDTIVSKMYEEQFQFISAVQYLKKYQLKTIYADYEPQDAIALAQSLAADNYIEAQQKRGGIDISKAAGPHHARVCSCGNKWDGISEECAGLALKLRWKVDTEKHHFLKPCVEPVCVF